MTAFAASWLQRREPFDVAARDENLVRRFDAALRNEGSGPRRIVDLAAGSGANFRALAPMLGGDQEWLLVDHDALLLTQMAVQIEYWAKRAGWRCQNIDGSVSVDTGAAHWRARTHRLDLASGLEQIDLASYDGVTTTAFLDLVSRAWSDRLCDWLTCSRRPLLATLTVDGRRQWHPSLPADVRVHDAFQRHQANDKGFGPALGCSASSYLAERLAALGYEVKTARSDWRIGAENRELLLQMVDESVAVVCEIEPSTCAIFADWSVRRIEHIRSGISTLDVGHVDLLALPRRL